MNSNGTAVQAICAAIQVFFALVLIGVTAVYAVANWRVVRVMRADLKLKWQPHLSVIVQSLNQTQFNVTIAADRATARIERIAVTIHVIGGQQLYVDLERAKGVAIADGQSMTFEGTHTHLATGGFDSWTVRVDYRDASGEFAYWVIAQTGQAGIILVPHDA